MQPRTVLTFSIALALAASVQAQSSGAANPGTAQKSGAGQPVFVAAAKPAK
jgi:hypothetical protein